MKCAAPGATSGISVDQYQDDEMRSLMKQRMGITSIMEEGIKD